MLLKKETANLVIGIAMLVIAFATLMLKIIEVARSKERRAGAGWNQSPNAENPGRWNDRGSGGGSHDQITA